MIRDVTLLWALRSPCHLACRYCYFGDLDEHRLAPPTSAGQLSHLSRTDASMADIDAFLSGVEHSAVQRVFLAGGEPLNWPPALSIDRKLKNAGVEVINGIRHLLATRGTSAVPKIGLYTVITRRNIPAIVQVAELAAQFGLDYFVPQPVSLPSGHKLHEELSLRPGDGPAATAALTALYHRRLPVGLPAADYQGRFAAAIGTEDLLQVKDCFGGHTLHFIEPDGSVWDCPSSYKIAATPHGRRRTIIGHRAAELFDPARSSCLSDCALASRDCVNMWPLMGFGR